MCLAATTDDFWREFVKKKKKALLLTENIFRVNIF